MTINNDFQSIGPIHHVQYQVLKAVVYILWPVHTVEALIWVSAEMDFTFEVVADSVDMKSLRFPFRPFRLRTKMKIVHKVIKISQKVKYSI